MHGGQNKIAYTEREVIYGCGIYSTGLRNYSMGIFGKYYN